MKYQDEIQKRRTFAIISHPDAGKTTLTEKLLLFGGAIQIAGAVKSNKIKKSATSDFMEIERQRGISVATSVMSFEYEGKLINILDTPGHKDFAEDTFRTLTAVDSVILVIDCVKGVEEQTKRLMEVCRMRHTPVIIFINKLDRDGKDPFDLLDELEQKLNIHTRPLSWPINMGSHFKGVYNLFNQTLRLFTPGTQHVADDVLAITDLNDPELTKRVGSADADKLRADVDLIESVYEPFNLELYRDAYLAPVFFGSAINNFGVKELLDTFINIAPTPLARLTSTRLVQPDEDNFSGFVFKIHANLDPKHRDRIAFMRICSGKFERNKFYHHVRQNKDIRFSNPTSFMAQKKNVIDEAFPGDVVGLYDSGTFKIGDTLTEGENFTFAGIPNFSPEIFRELINDDPMKAKQLEKGIMQLSDEGVVQLFTQPVGNKKIVGTVGELQFEVLQYRLLHEYKAACSFRHLDLHKALWITCNDPKKLAEFVQRKANYIGYDKDQNPVFLAQTQWILESTQRDYPDIMFHATSEFKTQMASV
ncbi:MAG TPA: peptide chain release factor 3 [Chitinophagales bacterium]|nr:peptide chain release factor 3 [Chitinophagales bacterium]